MALVGACLLGGGAGGRWHSDRGGGGEGGGVGPLGAGALGSSWAQEFGLERKSSLR